MTPQEQEMIGDLIDRVQKTQLAEKDIDAEQMLQQGMGRNPNALYILAQTVLVQKYALEQAQAQLAEAKAQIEQMQQHPEPKHASSFLGNLLGRNNAQAPPPPPSPQGWSAVSAYPQSVPPVGYPQSAPPVGYPQYGAPMGMGGGGFLQGALQTAAGVAAGALAFEGVESLMHGFGHAAGYGQGFGGFGGGGDRPTEVINNYYGDDRGERGEHGVSSDEHLMGDQVDRDSGGGKDDRGGSLDEKGTSDLPIVRRSTMAGRVWTMVRTSMTAVRILTIRRSMMAAAVLTMGARAVAMMAALPEIERSFRLVNFERFQPKR